MGNNQLKYQSYLLAFLWLSGLLKKYLNFYYVDLDIVILALGLAVFDIIFQILIVKNIKITRFSLQLILVLLLFYSWIIFTITYSPSVTYKFEKTGNFLANLIFFIYPLFIKKINFNIIIKVYSIILFPIAFFYIYMSSILGQVATESTQMFGEAKFDYLVLGFHLGVLFILLNYFKKKILWQTASLILLFASGARGPFVFVMFVALLINFKPRIKIRRTHIYYLVLTFLVGIIITTIYFDRIYPLFERSFMRFASLGSGNDHSANARFELIKFAFSQPFESIQSFFIGNGIGSFGILYFEMDGRAYPHNILLETFFELGLVGLIIMFFLFSLVFIKFSLKKNVFYALFLFAFFNAMKSSSLSDLWVFFSFIGGISCTYGAKQIKEI